MRAVALIALSFFLWTCANVTAPTGGPKDETPPKLLSSIPKQGQVNYTGKGITLEFDELIKLKSPKEEIIITPNVKDPKFTVKKNLFFIEFSEKLAENTTYSIAFREAIQDLNEGNPAEDLRLAFSTGPIIDSLQISGTVIQLSRGLPADKYTVAVYVQDTFNIFKHKPVYFTRTDKAGRFKITNLKADKYFIYSWEDKNKNLSLQSQSEKFGFLPYSISLTDHIDSIELKTIALDSRPINISGIRSLGHFTKIRLNKNIISYTLKSHDPNDKKINHSYAGSQSEIDIFPSKSIGDSTLVTLRALDSLNQTCDTTFYIKQTNSKSLKENISLTLDKVEVLEETQKLNTQIKLSELLELIQLDSIYIKIDTVRRVTLQSNDITYDTVKRTLLLNKAFQKKDSINWKQTKLVLGKGAIISIHGDSSKHTTSTIALLKAEERATLIIQSSNAKPNTILEVLNERYEIIDRQPHSKTTTFKNLPATTVLLRAIGDTNQNNKWDPGNPTIKSTPENITYYFNPEKKKQQIPLRANWEVSIKWNF